MLVHRLNLLLSVLCVTSRVAMDRCVELNTRTVRHRLLLCVNSPLLLVHRCVEWLCLMSKALGWYEVVRAMMMLVIVADYCSAHPQF